MLGDGELLTLGVDLGSTKVETTLGNKAGVIGAAALKGHRECSNEGPK